VCEVTSDGNMAVGNLCNRSITFVEDSTGGRSSNEVNEFSSLGNATVNREAETKGTVMSEYEGNNSDSIITTETSVDMTTRQLQDLLNNVITTLRADIVTLTETKFQDIVTMAESKFQDIVTMIEKNNSKFQA